VTTARALLLSLLLAAALPLAAQSLQPIPALEARVTTDRHAHGRPQSELEQKSSPLSSASGAGS
jgi:hypothetical protein